PPPGTRVTRAATRRCERIRDHSGYGRLPDALGETRGEASEPGQREVESRAAERPLDDLELAAGERPCPEGGLDRLGVDLLHRQAVACHLDADLRLRMCVPSG